jgi:putative oxidoreductase
MATSSSKSAVGYGPAPGAGFYGPETNLWRAFANGIGRVAGLESYGTLAARVLMSQIFILSGIAKVMDPAGTAQSMEDRGMFWVPFFLGAAVAVELIAGLALLVGFKARLGALLLFLFLIPVTLTFHNFWVESDPKEFRDNMILFMHNLTLMGGLLLVMTTGPGPLSIDYWNSREGARHGGHPDR